MTGDLGRSIHAIVMDRSVAYAFRDGDVSVLDGFALEPAERAALEDKDFAAMYEMGVHPVLLFHLSALLFPRTHYVKHVVPQLQGLTNRFYDYYRTRSDGEV